MYKKSVAFQTIICRYVSFHFPTFCDREKLSEKLADSDVTEAIILLSEWLINVLTLPLLIKTRISNTSVMN